MYPFKGMPALQLSVTMWITTDTLQSAGILSCTLVLLRMCSLIELVRKQMPSKLLTVTGLKLKNFAGTFMSYVAGPTEESLTLQESEMDARDIMIWVAGHGQVSPFSFLAHKSKLRFSAISSSSHAQFSPGNGEVQFYDSDYMHPLAAHGSSDCGWLLAFYCRDVE